MTFKEEHREFQELVRELIQVRRHNRSFKEGDPQGTLLMFAEASLVLVALERFTRMVLGPDANDGDTLPNLLQKATSDRLKLLRLPTENRDLAIGQIRDVRNTLLHGNYEQAAQQCGAANMRDYFKRYFAGEVETLFNLLDTLVRQVDPDTGRPNA